jgi:hypothetical protein
MPVEQLIRPQEDIDAAEDAEPQNQENVFLDERARSRQGPDHTQTWPNSAFPTSPERFAEAENHYRSAASRLFPSGKRKIPVERHELFTDLVVQGPGWRGG